MSLLKPAIQRDVWSLFDVAWAPVDGGANGYLSRIMERCADWFGATGGSLFLREDGSDSYWLAAKTGSHCSVPDTASFVGGEGIAGTSVIERKPIIVGDPMQDPLLAKTVRTSRSDLASAMVVPLSTPDSGCIGVLNLSRRKGLPSFRQKDLDQARSVGGHIALAVANARLYGNLREAQRQSAESHTKLQVILESLGVAVLVFDGEGRIHDRNLMARRLLRDQRLESEPGDSLDPNCDSPFCQCLQAALADALAGVSARVQARDEREDRAWSIVCTPLPDGGATAAIEEVTEHERALREMGRVRRLAEIGQMTASIAHEIRNPLTGIRSAAQMVRDAPEHAAEFAILIEEEVQKLNGLCEQFLEFAKPLALRMEPVRLGELVRHVAARHRPQFDDAGVDLVVQITGEQPTITGDSGRLEQVLHNLLRNAREACGSRGKVRVLVEGARLVVEDDGVGMSREVREQVFTPFFTTKAAGTGLGMCNVRKIVEAHGGSIELSSEPGAGTSIEVTLEEGV